MKTRSLVKRISYTKRGCDTIFSIIFDVFDDGSEEFWERETGEIRYYQFTPSPIEQELARKLYSEGVKDAVIAVIDKETLQRIS